MLLPQGEPLDRLSHGRRGPALRRPQLPSPQVVHRLGDRGEPTRASRRCAPHRAGGRSFSGDGGHPQRRAGGAAGRVQGVGGRGGRVDPATAHGGGEDGLLGGRWACPDVWSSRSSWSGSRVSFFWLSFQVLLCDSLDSTMFPAAASTRHGCMHRERSPASASHRRRPSWCCVRPTPADYRYLNPALASTLHRRPQW